LVYRQVIAAAQAGKHNEKRESYGDTLIIDPWGTVVGRLPGENPEMIKGIICILIYETQKSLLTKMK